MKFVVAALVVSEEKGCAQVFCSGHVSDEGEHPFPSDLQPGKPGQQTLLAALQEVKFVPSLLWFSLVFCALVCAYFLKSSEPLDRLSAGAFVRRTLSRSECLVQNW